MSDFEIVFKTIESEIDNGNVPSEDALSLAVDFLEQKKTIEYKLKRFDDIILKLLGVVQIEAAISELAKTRKTDA